MGGKYRAFDLLNNIFDEWQLINPFSGVIFF